MYSSSGQALPWARTAGAGAWPGRARGWIFSAGLLAILFWLAGLPFLSLVASSLSTSGLPTRFTFTLSHYQTVLSDTRTYTLLATSLLFAGASMGAGLALGLPLAWFVERVRLPAKNLVRAVILAQVAIPPVLIAMSWALLLSPRIGLLNEPVRAIAGPDASLNIYSFPGIVFVQALAFVPLVFVIVSPALRNLDATYEEAARMSGAAPLAVVRDITLPLLRPAVLVAALYGFIIGLLTFDIPATLGIPGGIFVFSSEIYFNVQRSPLPRYGDISVLSLLVLVVVIAAAAVYLRATVRAGRFATLSGRFRARESELSGPARAAGILWLGTYLVAGLALPVAVMLWTSLVPFVGKLSTDQLSLVSLGNYRDALATPSFAAALGNTAVNSTLAATAGTALAVLVAWASTRGQVPAGRLIALLALLPLVVPGVILGLSTQFVYIALPIIPIYGTLWILTVSHVTASLPFASRASSAALSQVHPELEEAGRIAGGDRLRVLRTITVPLIMPTLVFIWLWTFVHSVRDLSTSVMLYSPKSPVIANLLWQLWDYGNLTTGAAVATILLVSLFALAVTALTFLGRTRSAAGLL